MTKAYALIAGAAALIAVAVPTEVTSAKPAGDTNIVLVHGAVVDGSGWRAVYEILKRHGYRVSIVQEPLTSLDDDVAATKRVLDLQDGPVVLVGHSYGGTVITVAGADPKVKALVYVAALQPDAGESTGQLAGSMPPPSNDLKNTRTASSISIRPSSQPTLQRTCRRSRLNSWRLHKCRYRARSSAQS